MFIADTVKGFGLPLAGHKDNHAGLMNPNEIASLRSTLNIAEGDEWEPWSGLAENAATELEAFMRASPFATGPARKVAEAVPVPVPAIPTPDGDEQSTQAAFGRILLEIAKSKHPLGNRIVTTSPDVTVSTNLGACRRLTALALGSHTKTQGPRTLHSSGIVPSRSMAA